MTIASMIRSVSIDALLAARDHAVEKFDEIASIVAEIDQSLGRWSEGIRTDATVSLPACEVRVSYRDAHETAQRAIDTFFWRVLFRESQVDQVMDTRTREKLWSRLNYDPSISARHDGTEQLPPLTRENIEETMRSMFAHTSDFFDDAVRSVYRAISWDHKTNEPMRFKSRMILTGCLPYGGGYQGATSIRRDSSVYDLERVLLVLDGQPPADNKNGVVTLSYNYIPLGEWYAVPDTTGGSLFEIKPHKVGTLHWRTHRTDLIDKLNQHAARIFGMSLGRAH